MHFHFLLNHMNSLNLFHMEIIKRQSKKYAPKVDLTAMVDLGFLLITFFMLASAFVKPRIMEIIKPTDQGVTMVVQESKTLSLLIGEGDKLYGYTLPDIVQSTEDVKVDTLDYAPSSLRSYIVRRQEEVKMRHGHAGKLFVIIKPAENSSYQRLIDLMDEMLITNVEHYAIVKPNTMMDSLLLR